MTIFRAILFALIILSSCDGNNTNPLLIEARKKVDNNHDDHFYFEKAWKYVAYEGENSWNAIANFEKAIEINPSKAGYYNDIANFISSSHQVYRIKNLIKIKNIQINKWILHFVQNQNFYILMSI